jgi:predicted ribonuclease toxin of YeeF-YezG toxin-antitoxin module
MDVKYIPSDWEKMKDGIGDLIGLGRWGKGMIDTLKDLSNNLEDAESDIANYDSDGVITFHHTSQKSRYQGLFEDFKVLHGFTGKVGDIVDRTIDQPFYEDMDAFVEAMRDLTISNYTTTNRVGATETQYVYAGYGPAQSFEVPKTEVSLDDLFSGDNYYASQMKLEYDAWKELNPDEDFSQKEYQQAVLNTRAFEYESIRNQQEDKEFWVQIGALVVIVGATLICPPAGIALGAAYGAMELSSAVSGKDWVSGRQLGTSERWFRGLLAPLDIVPGVSGLTKFSSTVRLASVGDNIGQLGLKTGAQGSFRQGVIHIDNMVKTAGQQSITRLKSASAAILDTTNVMKNKLAKDTLEAGRLVDSAVTQMKNITPPRRMGLAVEDLGNTGKVRIPVENTHAVENKLKDVLSKIDGVNLGSGRVNVAEQADERISENILKVLQENNTSVEEFQRIKLTPVSELSDREMNLIFYLRESVEKPTEDTLMSKVVPIDSIDDYLRREKPYTTVAGYVAKYEDVANVTGDYKETLETLRLDYTYEKDGVVIRTYPDNGDSYAVIRFKYSDVSDDLIKIPYGTEFYGSTTDAYPCTHNGFLGGRNETIVPEWQVKDYDRANIQESAEMYRVVDGKEEKIAIFKNGRFEPIDFNNN